MSRLVVWMEFDKERNREGGREDVCVCVVFLLASYASALSFFSSVELWVDDELTQRRGAGLIMPVKAQSRLAAIMA